MNITMRFPRNREPDTKARDAAMVNELYKKSRWSRTEKNQDSFDKAEEWFLKKHKCNWRDFVREEEHER